MPKFLKNILLIVAVLFALGYLGFNYMKSQTKKASPEEVNTYTVNDLSITVDYSRPSKKGRVIFGELVPYGKVWRTGANEATELTVTKDILINGQELKAGTYALFTIPNPASWTIILNKDLGLWGAYNYNPMQDALRFDVPVANSVAVYEAFTIQIDPSNNQVEISLNWDKTRVAFSVLCQEPKLKP